MKGCVKMQSEKHLNTAVLVYLLLLLVLVIVNLINDGTILDVMYLVCVVCCVLKYFLIIKENRK